MLIIPVLLFASCIILDKLSLCASVLSSEKNGDNNGIHLLKWQGRLSEETTITIAGSNGHHTGISIVVALLFFNSFIVLGVPDRLQNSYKKILLSNGFH